jgi:hypothetical protein
LKIAEEAREIGRFPRQWAMRFLNWNRRKVQNLTAWEIWGFIAGRVFMSFGLGILAMQYYPQIVASLSVPSLIAGIALLGFAARGLTQKNKSKIAAEAGGAGLRPAAFAAPEIAPEPILRAGNDTISWACIFCRNQSLTEGMSLKMVNEVMEAIHAVPQMLTNWSGHDLAEVRLHLGCFSSSRWPDAPNLVLYFDQKLKEYGG